MEQDKAQLVKHQLASLVTALNAGRGSFTTWEINFIESVDEQFTARGSLSAKQQEILARLYEEKA